MQTTSESDNIPVMTADEIGKRVLNLIDSIKSTKDISAANIEKATGIKVELDPDDPNKYGFVGKVTDTWFYKLGIIGNGENGKPDQLMFSFNDQTHSYASMTPVCGLDFDDYSKQLKEIGFQPSPVHGEHNRVSFWDFSNGDVSVQIYVRGENAEKVTHDCVSKLIISV